MTENLPAIPSIRTVAVPASPAALTRLDRAKQSLRPVHWVGYPLAAYFIVALLTQVLFLHFLIKVLLIVGSLAGARAFSRFVRPPLPKGPTPEERLFSDFERVFSFVGEAGFEEAAKDGRAIIKGSIALAPRYPELIGIIDDSLRFHLNSLTQIAETKLLLEDDSPLDRNVYQKEKNWDRLLSKQAKRKRKSRVSVHNDGVDLRLGLLELSVDSAGVRFKAGRDFEFHIGDKPRKSGQPGTSPGTWHTPGQGMPMESMGNASSATNSSHLSELEKTAAHVADELKQLRKECEGLLVQSIRGQVEATAQAIRTRLEREKKVMAELGQPLRD